MSHDDPRRESSRKLARLLSQPDGLRLARLLQSHGYPDPPTEAAPSTEAAGEPRPIGVWRPKRRGETLRFERPEPGPFGDHHAARLHFSAEKPPGSVRVCFFGESAAAGYLYAPHLTPAAVLEGCLREILDAPVEVIDLARTNETLAGLTAIVDEARQLKPDALIVFAGNNWGLLETPLMSPYAPDGAARQRYGEALRAGGVFGPIERAARAVLDKAAESMARIAELARAIGAPLTWVTPEINLADWETLQPPPWLPGNGVARWRAAFLEAQSALAERRWDEAAQSAKALLDLDGGATPTAYRLLAKAWRGRGDLAMAAAYARAEADAAHYASMCLLGSPQTTSMTAALQKRAASVHGFACVDLPRLFAERAGSPLTDRRLFLDYCHLTREGMHAAMAGVAAALARQLGADDDRADAGALLRRLPQPEIAPEAEALAFFGAAIHSAHRLATADDRRPLLAHWLDRALDTAPKIAGAMADFVAARLAPCPAALTSAGQRNFDSSFRLTPQHGWRWDFLDADMLLAIRAAIAERDPALARDIDRRLRARHAAPAAADHPDRALWDPLTRFYPETMVFDDLAGRAFHRAPWPVSAFAAFAGDEGMTLTLEARLPSPDGSPRRGRAAVAVNGRPIGSLDLDGRWRRFVLRAPRDAAGPGLHRVSVDWPMPDIPGEQALKIAAERLELGLEADIHPVYGEVFRFSVQS